MKKKLRLSAKLTMNLILIGVMICATSCLIGYIKYTTVIERMYNDTAYQIAEVGLSYIDGDEVERSLETGVVSDALNQSLESLTVLCEEMNANYIYVAKLSGIDLTYVLDVDNPHDEYPPFVLGDTGQINPEFREDAKRIVENGERVDNYFYSESQFGYNTSAIVPVYSSDNRIVAILGVEIAMSRLQSTVFEYVLYAVIISSALILLFITGYLFYLRRKVIHPIQLVTGEAEKFIQSENKVSEKLGEIHTGDEIEALAQSLLKMEVDINEYITSITKITAEKERISAELDVAKNIQAFMLPCIFPAFPDRHEFDIYANMTPAKEVGGDFYDFFLVDDDHLAIVMADVSGKGVPAALFMVITKTMLKNTAQTGLSPKAILEIVNNQLCENNQVDMFVTVWLGIYQISTGHMLCANAGHEYPALMHKDGDYELIHDKHGFVLAGMENSRYSEYELQLVPGDKMFLYTDGVAEATNTDNQLYGTERMLATLNKVKDRSAGEQLEALKADIDSFAGETPQFDDITMLSFEVRDVSEKSKDS